MDRMAHPHLDPSSALGSGAACGLVATGAALALGAAALAPRRRRAPTVALAARGEPPEAIIKQGFSLRKVPRDLDAVVIGSGMGGLTAAALLAKAALLDRSGKRVLVLEQHDRAGGNLHTFTEKGFEFDTGLHYIGAVEGRDATTTKLLAEVCGPSAVAFAKTSDVFDTARFRGGMGGGAPGGEREFGMLVGRRRLRAYLEEQFPEEATAVSEYFRLLGVVARSAPLHFASKLLPGWFAALLRWLFPAFGRISSRTTAEVLASAGCSKELTGALSYIWGDCGLPPGESSFAMHATLVNHYMGGSFYPVGGPSAIARHAVATIEEHGGRVMVRAPVEEITIDASGRACGVRVKGELVSARVVISAAGAYNTFLKLLPQGARAGAGVARVVAALRAPALKPRVSMVSLFVGLSGSQEELQLPAHNVWTFPNADHDANWAAYKEDPSRPFAATFISCPSAKDPSWHTRHPGKSVALVLAPAPWSAYSQWAGTKTRKRGAEYEAMMEELKGKMLEELFSAVPQARGRVVHSIVGSPLSNDNFLGTFEGEIYGVPLGPDRFQQDFVRPKTPVPGLYLAGQDACVNGVLGAGFGGVLCALAVSPLGVGRAAGRILS